MESLNLHYTFSAYADFLSETAKPDIKFQFHFSDLLNMANCALN